MRAELSDHITLHVEDGPVEALLRVKDIYYIEAQDKRVRVVLKDTAFSDRRGIDEIERALAGEDFFRVHRSYLINFRYVARLDKNEILLVSGEQIPLSRLRKKAFKECFSDLRQPHSEVADDGATDHSSARHCADVNAGIFCGGCARTPAVCAPSLAASRPRDRVLFAACHGV